MFGLDERIAELGGQGSILVIAIVAVLLGARHATDPDHLAAVSALIAGEDARGARRAGRLGLAWGAGHATTITLFGIPIVVLDAYLPEPLQVGTETLIGVLIMVLAARLLLHARARRTAPVRMAPAPDPRSTQRSFGVGLLHGIGGSAGIGVLLLAAIPDHGVAIGALLLFATFTAMSMGFASSAFGRALAGANLRARVSALTPALGVFNLAFGAWYALGALGALPYVL